MGDVSNRPSRNHFAAHANRKAEIEAAKAALNAARGALADYWLRCMSEAKAKEEAERND